MKRFFITVISILLFCIQSHGQAAVVKDFQSVCDSLSILLKERTGVEEELKLRGIKKRGSSIDFFFTNSLSDFPWYEGQPQWFRNKLWELFPAKYRSWKPGMIYAGKTTLENFVVPGLNFSGNPRKGISRIDNPDRNGAIVRRCDEDVFEKGLSGKHIALWQSHGMYYEQKLDRWEWQRPCLFTTVEDMFTQSFVLEFLVPMIENAGGYVFLPRERDFRKEEIIVDNDYVHQDARGRGSCEISGKWTNAPEGFADVKEIYESGENPFEKGTFLKTQSTDNQCNSPHIIYRPFIPARGEYAVYVSYKSLPESTPNARYTVCHMGGSTSFCVNQRMGGGMWIYLGTFEFEQGEQGYVKVDASTPENGRFRSGEAVTSDAVKFGGGMGNISRGGQISGMPRNAEAARYYLQWSGVDKSIYSQNKESNDYRDDFMCRGDWVEWLTRGSRTNPSKQGKNIPIDLSLGFHSDAGATPNDSIIGTLAIHTLYSEGRKVLPDGESRMTSRELADLVQSQLIHDLHAGLSPEWTRRQLRDRQYRESRTPSCPAMLLELLSHQNFADMKYGLDPAFRFTASRAVYKGILKYLSYRHGCQYAVQPLGVKELSANPSADGTMVRLRWKERVDTLEKTAAAEGFILYTRLDDGAFDSGKKITMFKKESGYYSVELPIEKGHLYSFSLQAFNDGGKSFRSETVCAGVPENNSGCDSLGRSKVLIVNNFDRLSCPAFIQTDTYAGFDDRTDRGVPYKRDIAYVGDMFHFNRQDSWVDDDDPGFGASYSDYAGNEVAGNTFDFASIHARALMAGGFPVSSCNREALENHPEISDGCLAMDIICGKQVTFNRNGREGGDRYSVFPEKFRDAICEFTKTGGNLIVSGAYIATDVWSRIFPTGTDSLARSQTAEFVKNTFGYKLIRAHASRTASVKRVPVNGKLPQASSTISYSNYPNPYLYSVESSDGLHPVNGAATFLRYADTNISAGILYQGDGYRSVAIGFPLETIWDEKNLSSIIDTALNYILYDTEGI